MPTLEQKYRNTRILMFFISIFLFVLILGEATLFPLVLNYNYTDLPTNWYIFVLICTMFSLGFGIYLCVRVIRDTYADFFI